MKIMQRKYDLKLLLKLTTGVQLSSASHLQHPAIILGSEFQLPARFINSMFGEHSLEGSPTTTRQRWCSGSKQFLLCQKCDIFCNLVINIKWNNFVKANIYQWHDIDLSVHFNIHFSITTIKVVEMNRRFPTPTWRSWDENQRRKFSTSCLTSPRPLSRTSSVPTSWPGLS